MINANGLTIYTDGAARGNPGRGGFGAILMWLVKARRSQRDTSIPPTTGWS